MNTRALKNAKRVISAFTAALMLASISVTVSAQEQKFSADTATQLVCLAEDMANFCKIEEAKLETDDTKTLDSEIGDHTEALKNAGNDCILWESDLVKSETQIADELHQAYLDFIKDSESAEQKEVVTGLMAKYAQITEQIAALNPVVNVEIAVSKISDDSILYKSVNDYAEKHSDWRDIPALIRSYLENGEPEIQQIADKIASVDNSDVLLNFLAEHAENYDMADQTAKAVRAELENFVKKAENKSEKLLNMTNRELAAVQSVEDWLAESAEELISLTAEIGEADEQTKAVSRLVEQLNEKIGRLEEVESKLWVYETLIAQQDKDAVIEDTVQASVDALQPMQMILAIAAGVTFVLAIISLILSVKRPSEHTAELEEQLQDLRDTARQNEARLQGQVVNMDRKLTESERKMQRQLDDVKRGVATLQTAPRAKEKDPVKNVSTNSKQPDAPAAQSTVKQRYSNIENKHLVRQGDSLFFEESASGDMILYSDNTVAPGASFTQMYYSLEIWQRKGLDLLFDFAGMSQERMAGMNLKVDSTLERAVVKELGSDYQVVKKGVVTVKNR